MTIAVKKTVNKNQNSIGSLDKPNYEQDMRNKEEIERVMAILFDNSFSRMNLFRIECSDFLEKGSIDCEQIMTRFFIFNHKRYQCDLKLMKGDE